TKRVDFFALGDISFEKPDIETFRGLKLAYRAMDEGGSMPVVFNAANEYAVECFLKDRIGFLDIYAMIEKAMDAHRVIKDPSLEEILASEKETYELLKGNCGS
ncbi:MAG: 1-deoxy-D-xylulose-5-phosphate reductoisomerase, partial [Lachnospiraceae bacterium]|nr:1-deoxy-D-xylulose-5-phosphate reductoisomerase [Lachnospiraceae bacterium]